MSLRNTIFFTIFLIASLFSLLTPFAASQNSNVSAIFAFGDSTIDPGNNNYIKTLCRSDHSPYGMNFPGQVPTGRFCDGKLVPDFLIASLGMKELLPAYLDQSVTDTDLLSGVSFASAGSGLDPQTVVITQGLDLPTQLNNFYEALQRMEGVVRQEEVRRIVENALFLVNIGSNDMLFNYYDIPTRALEYSLPSYHQMQLKTMYGFIENLYKTGARRIGVAGLPPIGCVPVQVTIASVLPSTNFLQRSCVDKQNVDSQAYNQQLETLISSWQSRLQGSTIVYLDIYSPVMDMIQNPYNYGFNVTLEACCGTGLVEGGPLCNEVSPTCPDASKHIFFDSAHLTEAAYRVIADVIKNNLFPRLVGFNVTLEACCGTGLVEGGTLCNEVDPTCPDASKHIFFDSVHLTEAAYRVIADVIKNNLFPRLVSN